MSNIEINNSSDYNKINEEFNSNKNNIDIYYENIKNLTSFLKNLIIKLKNFFSNIELEKPKKFNSDFLDNNKKDLYKIYVKIYNQLIVFNKNIKILINNLENNILNNLNNIYTEFKENSYLYLNRFESMKKDILTEKEKLNKTYEKYNNEINSFDY